MIRKETGTPFTKITEEYRLCKYFIFVRLATTHMATLKTPDATSMTEYCPQKQELVSQDIRNETKEFYLVKQLQPDHINTV
jgi:hypothetical protein